MWRHMTGSDVMLPVQYNLKWQILEIDCILFPIVLNSELIDPEIQKEMEGSSY